MFKFINFNEMLGQEKTIFKMTGDSLVPSLFSIFANMLSYDLLELVQHKICFHMVPYGTVHLSEHECILPKITKEEITG